MGVRVKREKPCKASGNRGNQCLHAKGKWVDKSKPKQQTVTWSSQ